MAKIPSGNNCTSENISSVLTSALRQGIAPGLSAFVALGNDSNRKCFELSAGKLAPAVQVEVNADTIFDLASLTKMLSTTVICAIAIENGALDLREKPWPNWPNTSVENVLGHQSGLPGYAPFYQQYLGLNSYATALSRRGLVESVLALPEKGKNQGNYVYSDLGFIALGDLLERRFGINLDKIFSIFAAKYFETTTLGFRNLFARPTRAKNCAPTKNLNDPYGFRSGEVNDENCYAMGGVAGHAGLFGSLNDLKSAAIWMATGLSTKRAGIFSVLRQFAFKRPKPLGFDCAQKDGTTGGFLPTHSIGHLGFSGTSLWITPGNPWAIYILLCNKIRSQGESNPMKRLRVEFHQAASQWVRKMSLTI